MSYRIQVQPEAGSLLRTLAPHVVLRLGRALAQVADALSTGEDADGNELRVEDWVMRFVVDRAERLLRVVQVEQCTAPAYASDAAL
ncbi:MAG: hypothetical protein ACXWLM_06665 [Myxococcales bacterium]